MGLRKLKKFNHRWGSLFLLLSLFVFAACPSSSSVGPSQNAETQNLEVRVDPEVDGPEIPPFPYFAPPADGQRVFAQLIPNGNNQGLLVGLAGALNLEAGVSEVCAVNIDLPLDQQTIICDFSIQADGSFRGTLASVSTGDRVKVWTNGIQANGVPYLEGGPDSPNSIEETVTLWAPLFPFQVTSSVRTRDHVVLGSPKGLYLIPSSQLEGPPEGMTPRILTVGNGLTHNRVLSLASDEAGGVWVGTYDGISHLVGIGTNEERSINYTASEGSLPEEVEQIASLASDGAGGVWIGSGDRGLIHLKPDDSLESYAIANGQPENMITSILVEPDGGLWLGIGAVSFTFSYPDTYERKVDSATNQGGLSYRSPEGNFIHKSEAGLLPDQRVLSLSSDGSGGVWVGTYGGLAHLEDPFTPNEASTHFFSTGDPDDNALVHNQVRAFALEDSGHLWIATLNGLSHLDPSTHVFTNYQDHGAPDYWDYLECLLLQADGDLWIGTHGFGLYRLTEAGLPDEEIAPYRVSDDLPGSDIRAVLDDGTGGLWIGVRGGGLSHLLDPGTKDEAFVTRGTHHGLPNLVVYDVIHDGLGGLWIGTSQGLSHLTHPDTPEETMRIPEGTSGFFIRTFAISETGVLGSGTRSGLGLLMNPGTSEETFTLFQKEENQDHPLEGSLPHNRVLSMVSDGQDGFWVGTGGGLSHVTHLDQSPPTFRNFYFRDNNIQSLALDNSGGVWVGMQAGLAHLILSDNSDDAYETTYYDDENSDLPGFDINVLLDDQAGGLWISTDRGLVHLLQAGTSDEIFLTYTSEHGLPNERATSLAMDGLGGLWIGTYFGLVLFVE